MIDHTDVANLIVQKRGNAGLEEVLFHDGSGQDQRAPELPSHADGEVGALHGFQPANEQQAVTTLRSKVEAGEIDGIVNRNTAGGASRAQFARLVLADR